MIKLFRDSDFESYDSFDYKAKSPAQKKQEPKAINTKPESQKPKAIYAASLDPIHFGHIDIIQRAAHSFGSLEVAVGMNPLKNYTFSLAERVAMAKQALAHLPNVKVEPFTGLLVRYASQKGVETVIKGVRNSEDFHFETLCHEVGSSQNLGIETYLLLAKPEFSHVSSSAVKILQQDHGEVRKYVPLNVKQKLEERVASQFILGITGQVGSGKSYVGERFVQLGKQKGITVYNIELDELGHRILSNNPKYEVAREAIVKEFGEQVRNADTSIDRRVLAKICFSNSDKLKKLNEIMHPQILLAYQEELYGKKGIIIVNAALTAETDTSYLSNNNVILVKAEEKIRNSRLKNRGLDQSQINKVSCAQYSFYEKEESLKKSIKKDNHGKLWYIDNSNGVNQIEERFEEVLAYFKLKGEK